MGEIDREALKKLRGSPDTPVKSRVDELLTDPDEEEDSFWDRLKGLPVEGARGWLKAQGEALGSLGRVVRLSELPVGTAVSAGPWAGPPGTKMPWVADTSKLPEASSAFVENVREGDLNAAIEAYQDELDAGRGFWGLAGVGAAFIPTGGPALAGAKLLSAAPKLAGTIAKPFVPATRRGVEIKRGIETGLRGTGSALRLPWELEEAAGRLAVKGVGKVAGPTVRSLVSRFKQPVTEGPTTTPITPTATVAEEVDGSLARGMAELEEMPTGMTYVAPLRSLNQVKDEVVTSDSRLVKAAMNMSRINPSVARNTDVGKIVTAYNRQVISIDELTNVAVSAALDAHAKRWTGRMRHILPIDKNGYFGTTGKLWNDVFSNPGNRAFRLTTEQRAYIDDYIKVVDEIEAMRVEAGLEPRARTRKPGWFYVPRQVKGIRGLEIEGVTNPRFHRLYEEATEGAKQGIRYQSDPRETLMLHVRTGYREILQKQLDDALEPLSIDKAALDALIPSNLIARWQRAYEIDQIAKEATKKNSFSKAGQRKIEELEAEYQTAYQQRHQRNLFAKGSAELKRTPEGTLLKAQAIAPLEQRKVAAKDALDAAINAEKKKLLTRQEQTGKSLKYHRKQYNEAKAKAHGERTVPGTLFGPNQPDKISIVEWTRGQHRFFRREDYTMLKKGLEGFRTKEQIESGERLGPGFAQQSLQVLGNTTRFLASVGDFAMPFIQGQLVLATHPIAWAKMTFNHYHAFVNPRVQARFIRENLAEYQWMARNGVPIGDPEFFAALAPGQGLPLGSVTRVLGEEYGEAARNLLRGVGKQSFGRFQAAYNAGLGSARALLIKSLRPTWKGTDAELAQYIRNLTGGLDSRAIGIGPSGRAAEGMWLAFSPRLLRSTIALVGDAARAIGGGAGVVGKPMTPQGIAAVRTLSGWLAGVVGIYVTTGWALGKSKEEIREGLNPLNGRRFLSHNINGDYIGVGGQVRALAQLIGSLITTAAPGGPPVQNFLSFDQYDNPLIRFYTSRGAPALNIVGGAIEAISPIDALPYDDIDGIPDLPLHIATSALPFALQSLIDGSHWTTVTAEMVGARGGTDPRDRRAQEMFDQEYRNLQPFLKKVVRELEPEYGTPFSVIEDERRRKVRELAEEVKTGIRDDSHNIWLEWRKINDIAKGARGEAGRDSDYPPPDLEVDKPNELALNQRNALFDDPEVMTPEGRYRSVRVGGKTVSMFSLKLAALEKNWSEEQKYHVLLNSNLEPIPLEILEHLPKEQRRSIIESQRAREQYLKDQGLSEFVKQYRAMFSLEWVPDN